MKNKIEDLRNHLFATLEALSDEEKPMDLERARAIADVGRVLVDSAKAEVDFLKVTGGSRGTGFIPEMAAAPKQLPSGPPVPTLVRTTAEHVCAACKQRTDKDPCEFCNVAGSRVA